MGHGPEDTRLVRSDKFDKITFVLLIFFALGLILLWYFIYQAIK